MTIREINLNPAGAVPTPVSGMTSTAGDLRKASVSVLRLASFFQAIGWLIVIVGVLAGLAIAANGGSSSSSDVSTGSGLIVGVVTLVSGLWLVLLARCAEVLARHAQLQTAAMT